MSRHLTPSEVCEALIGKPAVLGEVCHVDAKSPFGWRLPSKNRAAGDIPSATHMRSLLAFSAARNLGLTADHLIWGADEDEVAAILASRGSAEVAFRPNRVAAE